MIFINLGIVLGAYIGSRIHKELKHRYPHNPQPAPLDAPKTTAHAIEQNTAVVSLSEHKHHFRVSTAALMSTTVAYIFYPPLSLLNLGLITYTAAPMLDLARDNFRKEKNINNHGLSLAVTGLCVITGGYLAAAVQNWVYHLGCRMVEEGKENTKAHLTQAFIQHPEHIWVLKDGIEMQIPLDELCEGDIVMIKMGEFLPIDGFITRGSALIDQQSLTGEASPVERFVGDQVMAGSLLIGGTIEVKASHSGADSQAHQLNKLLEQTRDYKTDLQLKGEAWADNMAAPLLAVSGATALFFGLSPATALLFSAPTNTVRALLSLQTSTHLQWAAEQGILIKDGRVLEELPWIDTVLFDKTGTLTHTEPEVAQVVSCGDIHQTQLLRLAAAAEQHLQHPIATAIIKQAQAEKLELPEVDDSYYNIGFGIQVSIQGHAVHVGSQRFIQEVTDDYHLPSHINRLLHDSVGNTFIFIAVDKKLQGVIELYPRLREEVPQVLQQLRDRGLKHFAVVSGDQLAPTERLAHSLGIQRVFAEVLPQDKAALIRNLQQQGHRVCFIGDGVNDAIAMKQANVSVCLSSAAEITRNTAQIVLLNDELTHLRDSFDMAVHLQVRLSGNLLFWLGFGLSNAMLVPLAGLGPLQSSLLYAGGFAWGFKDAKKPGWLAQDRDQSQQTREEDIIEGRPMPSPVANGSSPYIDLTVEPLTI